MYHDARASVHVRDVRKGGSKCQYGWKNGLRLGDTRLTCKLIVQLLALYEQGQRKKPSALNSAYGGGSLDNSAVRLTFVCSLYRSSLNSLSFLSAFNLSKSLMSEEVALRSSFSRSARRSSTEETQYLMTASLRFHDSVDKKSNHLSSDSHQQHKMDCPLFAKASDRVSFRHTDDIPPDPQTVSFLPLFSISTKFPMQSLVSIQSSSDSII